jgi:hypothetical protein
MLAFFTWKICQLPANSSCPKKPHPFPVAYAQPLSDWFTDCPRNAVRAATTAVRAYPSPEQRNNSYPVTFQNTNDNGKPKNNAAKQTTVAELYILVDFMNTFFINRSNCRFNSLLLSLCDFLYRKLSACSPPFWRTEQNYAALSGFCQT